MDSKNKQAPRGLQQQQSRDSGESQQQQQQGSTDFQSKPAGSQVEGEGSYTATRDYQKNIKEYLDKADVKADGEAARPRSEQEAQELKDAEKEGRSHSKGER